jgi:hypothetical protein
VRIATDIVNERHTEMYKSSQQQLSDILSSFKENKQTIIPVAATFNDFKLQPTMIEVQPTTDGRAVKSKKRIVVAGTFMLVLFMSLIVVFYQEGKRRAS